jgi:1-acyl-sn-glycerol-3-phosphate acyltransferase
MSMAQVFVRSLVFVLLEIALTVVFGIIALLSFVFPPHTRYRIITVWTHTVLWLLERICGLDFRVLGREHIPDTPSVILCKHQSAWETLALQRIFPPQVWVLKRELLRMPFFGWGLAALSPIAIDRAAGRQALDQLVEQGRQRFAIGFWVVIFPEGTRVPPGEHQEYRVGGAWLAAKTGVPIVPVAHNAGTAWGKNAFLKHPGTITVSIGPAIDPRGRKAGALIQEVERWIEAEVARLGTART